MESEEVTRTFCQIPIERLRQLLRYEPETGRLFWLPRIEAPPFTAKCAHREAGLRRNAAGYHQIRAAGCAFYAHRVAWALFYGEWPTAQIDHIDGDKSNQRISNLRNVTMLEQSRNKPITKRTKRGQQGVRIGRWGRRWEARICVLGRIKYLGTYDTFDEAVLVRKAAEARLGFHQNHGRLPQADKDSPTSM